MTDILQLKPYLKLILVILEDDDPSLCLDNPKEKIFFSAIFKALSNPYFIEKIPKVRRTL